MPINNRYNLQEPESIISPQLIYYKDLLEENIKKIIDCAGDVNRLWPHVKSHKMIEMVKMQQSHGINRFKCATIAEAEMLGDAEAKDILLAYPVVGPNKQRFLALMKTFPKSHFWAIGDDLGEINSLGKMALKDNMEISFLVDVNMGMNRTGVPLKLLKEFYQEVSSIPGIHLQGMHCYDGDHHEKSFDERLANVKLVDDKVLAIRKVLMDGGLDCSIMVMGGTPSFPCHARLTSFFLSPGTCFINDAGYYHLLPDLPCTPAAAILTRVISLPAPGIFTLDLGYKAMASDPTGLRGELQNFEHANPILQNEEHWVFKMDDGYEKKCPKVGDVMYVVPTHICPTSALYPEVPVSLDGRIIDHWQVTARNRKITI